MRGCVIYRSGFHKRVDFPVTGYENVFLLEGEKKYVRDNDGKADLHNYKTAGCRVARRRSIDF